MDLVASSIDAEKRGCLPKVWARDATNTRAHGRNLKPGFDALTLVPEAHRSKKDAARTDHAAELKARLIDVRLVLDGLGLLKGAKRQPRGFIVCCPWHMERTPSCSVQLKDGAIVAHCLGRCQRSGSVLDLVAGVRGLDIRRDFQRVMLEAAELGELWDIRDELIGRAEPRSERPKPHHQSLPSMPEAEPGMDAATFRATADVLLSLSPLEGSVAVGLLSRGLLDEAQRDGWGELPTVDDHKCIVDVMKAQFAPNELKWILRGNGFAYPDHRLLIPWRGPDGSINEVQRRYAPQYGTEHPPDGRKYVWPSRSLYAPVHRFAYGLNSPSLADAKEVWIVEGAVDVLAIRTLNRIGTPRKLAALGIPGVSMWKAFRESILPHLRGRVVHVAFDADMAGEQAVGAALEDIRNAGSELTDRPPVPHGLKDWAELAATLRSAHHA